MAGIDPGQTGAIAILADGQFAYFIDMPTMPRKSGGFHIDGSKLALALRAVRATEPEATCFAVLESVNAGPDQGVSSVFRFGESYGVARGVLGALNIPFMTVHPSIWKRELGLSGQKKDFARVEAIKRFPNAADLLKLVKNGGRADALWLAFWGHRNQCHALVPESATRKTLDREIAREVISNSYELPALQHSLLDKPKPF